MDGWLPHKLAYEQDQLLCRWFYAGEKRFTEPFFDETILDCLSHPYHSKRYKCVSRVDALPFLASMVKSIRPTAFLFHVSRCGSTLLSQAISISQRTIVLSEVPVLDQLLQLSLRKVIDQPAADDYFLAALSLLGQKRTDAEQFLFVKTDSWHILFYQRLRQLFPGVPFILLYRRPDEVIRSHQRKRGMHAVPGVIAPKLFGFDEDITRCVEDLDVYLAKVLETYFTAFLNAMRTDTNIMVANYNEGALSILRRIEKQAGMVFTQEEWAAMENRVAFDAKVPAQTFAAEELIPVDAAPPYLQTCLALYQQLEAHRCLQVI